MDPGAPDIQPGRIVAGKYRVLHALGKGGMGVVVAAEHVELGRRVAIKFLLETTDKRVVERFLREARATAQIQDEHVALVTDVGGPENGAPFVVMEYLEGKDLGLELEQNGTLPMRDAVDYALQVCEALAQAHAMGIVHRDIKPGNLFLTRRPDGSPLIKVLDFGISKIIAAPEEESEGITTTGTMLGSPMYMSPEQLRNAKNVDARADVWSLGATLHQLITGVGAFEGPTAADLLAMILVESPRPMRARRPDLPAELDAVVLRCLERDVTRRVQTVAELARALEPFGSAAGQASVERIVRVAARLPRPPVSNPTPSDRTISPDAITVDGWGTTHPTKKRARSRRMFIGVSAGVAVLLGILFFGVHATRSSPVPDAMAGAPGSVTAPAPSSAAASTIPSTSASAIPVVNVDALPEAPTTTASTPASRAGSLHPSNVTPRKTPRAGSAPNCNPAYDYDPVTQTKRWKRECL